MSKAETVHPLDNAFRDVLNSYGYSFQYSVIRTAERLYAASKSGWIFEIAEFPLWVQEKDSRIDLVLGRGRTLTYIIKAECQRVNPALGHWVIKSCWLKQYRLLLASPYYSLVEPITYHLTFLDFLASQWGAVHSQHSF